MVPSDQTLSRICRFRRGYVVPLLTVVVNMGRDIRSFMERRTEKGLTPTTDTKRVVTDVFSSRVDGGLEFRTVVLTDV